MFKRGDKVVCIDDVPRDARPIFVKKNEIYTIQQITWEGRGVLLYEIESDNPYGYWAFRFKKLENDFGTLVLEQIKQQIEEEELELIET